MEDSEIFPEGEYEIISGKLKVPVDDIFDWLNPMSAACQTEVLVRELRFPDSPEWEEIQNALDSEELNREDYNRVYQKKFTEYLYKKDKN